jgi:hypothetical protein
LRKYGVKVRTIPSNARRGSLEEFYGHENKASVFIKGEKFI